MTAASVTSIRSQAAEISLTEFEQGRHYLHPDGTSTRFKDDKWILQVSGGPRRQRSVNFADIPDTFRPYLKRAVAHDWLVEGKSFNALTQMLTSFRRGLRAISAHDDVPIESFGARHVQAIQSWLLERHRIGVQALAVAEREKGKTLASREAKAILKEVGGYGPKAISETVNVFNRVFQCARESGVETDVAFNVPLGVAAHHQRVGGADPSKILSPDEMAAIIEAAQADINEYTRVRRVLDRLDNVIGNDVATPESKNLSRLKRYLGANGHEPQSLKRIARDDGIAFLATRSLMPLLVQLAGESAAREILHLRQTMRPRGPKAPTGQRRRAREDLRKRVNGLEFGMQDDDRPYEEAMQRHFGLRGNRVHSYSEAAEKSGLKPFEFKSFLRRTSLFTDRVTPELAREAVEARAQVAQAHKRAIKACALQLLAVTARRISALLLSLPAKPETKWITHNGERLFCIQLRAMKMWGDEGLPERVELPGYLGEVAEQAIGTALELTSVLRDEAEPDTSHLLFIYHNDVGPNTGVRALTSQVLHAYVHSHRGDGLLIRRQVPRAEEISTHWFRHTAGQAITKHTAQPIFAAKFLGNSPQQAATAYCSMGTPEMRKQAATFIEGGQISGTLFDSVVRLKLAADGSSEPALPASQLSVEDAINRVNRNPNFLWDITQGEDQVSPELASEYLKRGMVINLTTRGGCILPASEGPCPASDECPIGCDPEANEKNPGCGCRWQVLIPHDEAIATLTSDLESLRQQMADVNSTPEYRAWASHLQNRINIWESQLARLQDLRSKSRVG